MKTIQAELENMQLPLMDNEFKRIKNHYKNFDLNKLPNLIKNMDSESINQVKKATDKISYILKNYEKEIKQLEKELVTESEFLDIAKKWQKFIDNVKFENGYTLYGNYKLPVNMLEYSVFVDKHQIDEIENLESVKNKNIIDVGGFIGDSALILSPLTNKKVYSFEIEPNNYKYLKETIDINHLNNVVALNLALGDKNDNISINSMGSGTTIDVNKTDDSTYSQITLDNFVKDNHNLQIGLIKVDIEGYEMNFLRGAINTIREQKPILLISIYHNWNDYSGIKPYIESLDLGYKFKIRALSIATCISETVLICEVI